MLLKEAPLPNFSFACMLNSTSFAGLDKWLHILQINWNLACVCDILTLFCFVLSNHNGSLFSITALAGGEGGGGLAGLFEEHAGNNTLLQIIFSPQWIKYSVKITLDGDSFQKSIQKQTRDERKLLWL